jgi:hypothetical protein
VAEGHGTLLKMPSRSNKVGITGPKWHKIKIAVIHRNAHYKSEPRRRRISKEFSKQE